MEPKDLLGKIIYKAAFRGIPDCDDQPFLDLEFTDGTKCTIVADYDGWTGNSQNEYPRKIYIRGAD